MEVQRVNRLVTGARCEAAVNTARTAITDSGIDGTIVYRFANGTTARLSGGLRQEGTSSGVYLSYSMDANGEVQYDNKFTYTVSGADLVITATGDAGSSITVKDFATGHIGLTLSNHAGTPPVIYGTELDDRWIQGVADFSLRGSASADEIRGLGGADELYGFAGDDALYGGAGQDTIYGRIVKKLIEAGADDDELVGEAGSDILSGGAGDDYLTGDLYGMGAGSGDDYLHGGAGNDTLVAGGGNDILFGGDDDDFMDGDADSTPSQYHGTDYLDGGAGNDNLYGDAIAGVQGDDYLDGGASVDILYGNDANDTLIGGTGNDTLYGGYGSDIHVYALGDGNDTLYDFHAASDSNTLRLGAGITLAGTKLAFRAQGYQLTFSDGGSIQLKGDYSYSVSSGGTYTITNAATKSDIQRVEFEDGTSMSWLQMV